MKILIVEDVNIMRRVVRHILVENYNVNDTDIYDCDSAEIAVKFVKQYSITHIFLDINLPGMDGVDAISEILKVNPNAYIIMCTSSKSKTMLLKSIKSGAKGYLLKPISPNKVGKALNLSRQDENDDENEETN